MSELRSTMNLHLKSGVVPALRALGFKGSLPHFRRIGPGRIDLVTFQFDRNGGRFVVEISLCAVDGVTTHWGKKIGPKAVTAWDIHPDLRWRLQPAPGGQGDHWFRFDSGQFVQCVQQVMQCLPSAEEWWQARAETNQSPKPPLVSHSQVPASDISHAALSKTQLHALADGLLEPESWIVQRCVEFILAETRGLWHGRARAMMCRRLKHCELSQTHRIALVTCIMERLATGVFSEQFKDQIRLALHINAEETHAVCRKCAASTKPHVRRYAQWALSSGRSVSASGNVGMP